MAKREARNDEFRDGYQPREWVEKGYQPPKGGDEDNLTPPPLRSAVSPPPKERGPEEK